MFVCYQEGLDSTGSESDMGGDTPGPPRPAERSTPGNTADRNACRKFPKYEVTNFPNMRSQCAVNFPNMRSQCAVNFPNMRSQCTVNFPNMRSQCAVNFQNMMSQCAVNFPNMMSQCAVNFQNMRPQCAVNFPKYSIHSIIILYICCKWKIPLLEK